MGTDEIVYDLSGPIASTLTGTAHGIKFFAVSGGIQLDVEDTDDNDTPYTFTSPTITSAVSSGIVTVGQSISIKASNGNEEATFTVPDLGYSSGSGGSGIQTHGVSDPVINNVVFTKTDDDSVTLAFDWDENDGTFNQYSLFRVRPNTVLYNNTQGVSGSSGSESRTESDLALLGGLEEGDKLYLENSSTPLHIVSGFGGISYPYTHKVVDFSIGNVSGVKSVI